MKRLLLALLVLACAAQSEAGFTASQHVYNNGTTGTSVICTLTNNPASGSVVAVSFFWFDGVNNNAGTVTVQDGNANSYTVTPNSPSNSRPTTAGVVYLARLIAGGTAEKTITVSYTQSSVLKSCSVDEFTVASGTAAFDQDAAGTGTTGPTINTPTVTVTGSNELTYSAGVSDHTITSVDSPWTQIFANGAAFAEAAGYILSRTGNVAVAMTENSSLAGASGWDTMAMSFTFTPSGGGGCTTPRISLSGLGPCH